MKTKLNEKIRDCGLRKVWIADRLGVDPATLSRWCMGHQKPALETAARLIRLVPGLTIEDLVATDGEDRDAHER